jgi:carboxylesterase
MNHNPNLKNPHLEGDDFYWPGNSTGILLIHGFTATTAEVRPLAQRLHTTSGYTVAGPLLPGHGSHPDDLNRATWHMWVEKVKHCYQSLISNCQTVYVGGESMGGLLTLELAHQRPEIPGLFLFAPAIKIQGLWIARLLWPFIKHQNKKIVDDGLAWKGYFVNPVRAGSELHKLQKHVQRRLGEIYQPVAIFTGGRDRNIAPDSAQMILGNIGSSIKHHYHMVDSAHCLILDREKDQIADHVLDLIRSDFRRS